MNKYWKYVLFPNFLNDIKDNTYVDMDDVDLNATLNSMVITAIQDFKFCKKDLSYLEDSSYDALDGNSYGYYFTDDSIGDSEYRVLLALMKVQWISAQITLDNNFKNPFFDKDIKGYSPGNLLTAMRGLLAQYEQTAKQVLRDYNKIDKDGNVAWGKINHAK